MFFYTLCQILTGRKTPSVARAWVGVL